MGKTEDADIARLMKKDSPGATLVAFALAAVYAAVGALAAMAGREAIEVITGKILAGADLENIMNEAAILCAREGKEKITMRHLNDAIERVQMGPEKKSHIVSDEDKRLVACHEAGHAIVGELLGGAEDVSRLPADQPPCYP